MTEIRSLCVYCGSSSRGSPVHHEAARALGRLLAAEGIELVYGGGRIGLMGMLADAALAAGGRVTGIIPRHLMDLETGHHGLSELVVVDSMHERKNLMFDRADGFVALPGGLGTLDETFEMLTWRQLSLHDKPIVVVDVAGYWRPLRAMVEAIVAENYANALVWHLFTFVDHIDDVLPAIAAMPAPEITGMEKLF